MMPRTGGGLYSECCSRGVGPQGALGSEEGPSFRVPFRLQAHGHERSVRKRLGQTGAEEEA